MKLVSVCLLAFGEVNKYFTQALYAMKTSFVGYMHFSSLSDLISVLTNPSYASHFTQYTHLLIWNTEFIPVELEQVNDRIVIKSIDAQAVDKLLSTNVPIVSALCKYKTFRAVINEHGHLVTREYMLDWAPFVPVYATSSDFLLIDTKLIQQLVSKWDVIPNPRNLTEDYLITYKLRKLGYEPIVNVNVTCVRVVERMEF